ncbi:Uncharacterised protein [Escherichia coli]|uniref:Uncharacterized protein n=1 Tax=Escherichia coli TaxID=562 RepID=A0A2X1MYA0_ECOLX|nr:Uncharacterised protein [Escherichia coli]
MPMIQRDFVEPQSKRYRGNIRARRSCLMSARAVKIYAARVLWLRPPPENGQKFPSYLFFQAEANVVIFSKTLHVESNTVTVS